jgi:glutamine amidotransferase
MIAVLNTRIANVSSVLSAMERIGSPVKLTQDPDEITQSDRVILPGVGTAAALMDHIHTLELEECLRQLTQPVLGICLGMQALFQFSAEGNSQCLGIFPGRVSKIQKTHNLPIPHMGWNQVTQTRESLLMKGIPDGTYFYFVHSYRVPDSPVIRAISQYGESIPSIIESNNWMGTQFHPERSGKMGEILLKNFLTC